MGSSTTVILAFLFALPFGKTSSLSGRLVEKQKPVWLPGERERERERQREGLLILSPFRESHIRCVCSGGEINIAGGAGETGQK
jgi:hypothetical protein